MLLEEPPVLAGLVSLLELGADHVASLLFLHGILHELLVDICLVKADINRVTSRHHVVIVDDLQEWLDLRSLLDFFFDIFLVTLRGYLSIPATRAWLKGLSLVPSSEGLTMTAFLPAYLPPRRRTTLPAFIILPMLGSLVEVNQAILAWS